MESQLYNQKYKVFFREFLNAERKGSSEKVLIKTFDFN